MSEYLHAEIMELVSQSGGHVLKVEVSDIGTNTNPACSASSPSTDWRKMVIGSLPEGIRCESLVISYSSLVAPGPAHRE
jgi:hypothetical protein